MLSGSERAPAHLGETAMRATPALLTALLIALTTAAAHAEPGPSQAELNAAAANSADWLLTNHDYGGQRFVDATEITRDNAASLRAVCVYQAADLRPFHTNPLVHRGIMYLTTSQATIALDAATCRALWRHEWTLKGRRNWPQSRGVVMNPVDHPHGGGEGRTSGGRHPVSPWGKPEGRTRSKKKPSQQLIIRRRRSGKGRR